MNSKRFASAFIVFIATVFTVAETSFSRTSDYVDAGRAIQPYRAVFKAGSPDLLGLELEAIIPGVGNWLGVWVGFTYLAIGHDRTISNGTPTEEDKGGLDHFGIGTNFYLTGGGSGLLASVGYDRVSAFTTVLKTQTGRKSNTNPTHLLSLELGYKYIGSYFTYSFFAGYGWNFAYGSPDTGDDKRPLINKGDWILGGLSFGLALPFML